MSAEATKPAVTYTFSYSEDFFEYKMISNSSVKRLSDEFAGALQESGDFTSVSEGSFGGDIYIEAHLLNSGDPAAVIPAFITGLSLWTIPSWFTDRWYLTTKVRTADQKEYSYSLEDADIMIQWLPMIVFTPFKFPAVVSQDVRNNLYRNLIVQMRKDGILQKPIVKETP